MLQVNCTKLKTAFSNKLYNFL